LPFKPFPKNFLDLLSDLEGLPLARVLDLGSGEGAFGHLLAESGIQVVELDCSALASGGSIPLRADALHPPILPGRLDCLLAGNLLRHLLVQDAEGAFLNRWLDLLKPGGTLFIFEDEPTLSEPAARNFLDLQAFLADLQPTRRGPLISRDFFLKWAKVLNPAQYWQSGIQMNQNTPDANAVCQMLSANGTEPIPGGVAGELLAAIDQYSLSYGSFWWASATIDGQRLE